MDGQPSSSSLSAGRIALGYAVIAILWIAFSDAVVTHFRLHPAVMTIKGTAFVFVTASLLYFTIGRLVQAVQLTFQKRAETEEALFRSNRELRAISNCNQVLLRATDEQSLLQEICRIVCEEAGYRMAWVGYAEHDEAKSLRPVAWAGAEEGYLATASISWADTERGRGPGGTAIRSGKTCYTQDYATDPGFAPWRESAVQRGFRSGIVLPLKDEQAHAFGCLCIYCVQPNAFTPEEIRLLEEMAADLAFGLNTLRSRAARQQAEQEVALLSFALHKVREAALLIDDEGCFRYVNEEACRALGYSRAELLGMTLPDIDPELPVGRWPDHWRERKEHGSTIFESRHRNRDGRIFPVEISANYFEYGGRAYTLALARDITERKRAEEALRQSEVYLTEAQRLSHTGSWAFDLASDKYVYVSEEDYRIWGFDPREGSPTGEAVLQRIHPEDRNRWKAKFEKSLREKTDSFDDYRIVLPDGTVKHIYTIRHPVLNDAGDVIKLVGTTADITERRHSEQALRRSEAYLKEAQRLSRTGSWALDARSEKYHYWSEEMFRIYELDPHAPLPSLDTIVRRAHPEDIDVVRASIQKSIREKVDTSLEFRLTLPSGTVKHVHVVRHPVLNDAGKVVTLVGALMDITERKQAEEALRRTAAYLAETQKLTRTGTFVTDDTTKPLYWSEELFRIFGLDPQQGLPTRDEALQRIHPEDHDKFRQASQRTIREKLDSDVEYRIVLPDGTVKHVYGLGHPVSNAHGELVEVVGTTVDVTERKRAEQELSDSETRFRTFVDHAVDAFFMLDFEQGTILDVNRPACESLGYTREELVGTNPAAFHLDSEQAQIGSVVERAVAGETVLDRHRHRRKDGTLFPVETNTSSFWYGGRRFLLKVARDISDRLQAEEQRDRLRQLEADLAHIHRVSMMGELTASIAHEVNQPLSGVVSNASAGLRWLAGDAPNLEEARESLRRIVRDGKRAAEVIARIRAMTKRTAAAGEKLDLNETIQEVLVLVGDEAKKNKVLIRTPFANDLSPVLGDRVQLQQVALNLVMNGIEAMSSVGERTRELVITTRNIEANQVQVTVEDSGIGLDPNTIEKIFDPFYSTKAGGMGMGLSICRSIVQHHGGRLWATAKDGPGTSFHFTLTKYQEEEPHAGVTEL
jgi:PAS domain S-box-containing protein